MYLMRLQELGSDKVTVVTAKGKIETIIQLLGNLAIHVVGYTEYEEDQQGIMIINPKPRPRRETMSQFSLVINQNQEYKDIQQFDEIAEVVSFANNCTYGNRFEIHKPERTEDYLRGEKRDNGHIDWVRTKY